jgi:hypothetical protein
MRPFQGPRRSSVSRRMQCSKLGHEHAQQMVDGAWLARLLRYPWRSADSHSAFSFETVITLVLVITNIWGAEARIHCHKAVHLHQPFELFVE